MRLWRNPRISWKNSPIRLWRITEPAGRRGCDSMSCKPVPRPGFQSWAGLPRRHRQESCNFLVEKLAVLRVDPRSRGMTPERRNRREGDVRNEPRLVARVGEWKIEVCLRRHVEQ